VFVHRENVRFRDLDALGHVNNAVFLTYIESARVAFLQHLGAAATLEDMSIIVARIEIDFRAPVGFGEEVEITVRATRFGTKSFDLDYELRVDGKVVAEAKSVLVGYDYVRGESVEIPVEWREWLEPAEVTV
jgi:acyl-CoA thioester hydrolase